jgi:hypothetical protein
MPCTNKAAANPSSIPTACMVSQKENAVQTQNAKDQAAPSARSRRSRSAANPSRKVREPSKSACAARSGRRPEHNLMTVRTCRGRVTRSVSPTTRTPMMASIPVVSVATDLPATVASVGSDGCRMATAMSKKTTTKSRNRSTTSEATAPVADMRSSRAIAQALASSPTRAGRRLLAPKPMHTAAKQFRIRVSALRGYRNTCHRIARTKNPEVPIAMANNRSNQSAPLSTAHTSRGSAPRSTHPTRRMLMRTPRAAFHCRFTSLPTPIAPVSRTRKAGTSPLMTVPYRSDGQNRALGVRVQKVEDPSATCPEGSSHLAASSGQRRSRSSAL